MKYPKYKKVLFCTDFSENSDYAFEFAFGIAKRDDGLLYVLHVIPDNPYQGYVNSMLDSETLEKIQGDIKEGLDNNYTERYVKKIEKQVRLEIFTKSGREDEEILKFAKEQEVDIIVMSTHGRTGIEHAFFGSVAEKVIRNSPFPIFVIPRREKHEP